MTIAFNQNVKNIPTRILFLKKEEIDALLSLGRRYVIITDTQVAELYGNALENALKAKGFDVVLLTIPQGENGKTRRVKEIIEDAMLSLQFGRDSCVIALGGGVVSDLAGFIAATYCRGIPWICIPTTLLAMVDASIGGKTAVNTPQGKNMIGAFYRPSLIGIDLSLLSSLPEKEWRNGYAEMIKYGLIASSELFENMERKDEDALLQNIRMSISIKKKTIQSDFLEKGKRRILNFGHTFGHALEKVLDYQISHGEAVAIGMACESFLSMKLGFLEFSAYNRILTLLQSYGFTLQFSVPYQELIDAMSRDKKALYIQQSRMALPRFVLIDAIGSPLYCEGNYCMEVGSELLREAYEQFSHHS